MFLPASTRAYPPVQLQPRWPATSADSNCPPLYYMPGGPRSGCRWAERVPGVALVLTVACASVCARDPGPVAGCPCGGGYRHCVAPGPAPKHARYRQGDRIRSESWVLPCPCQAQPETKSPSSFLRRDYGPAPTSVGASNPKLEEHSCHVSVDAAARQWRRCVRTYCPSGYNV